MQHNEMFTLLAALSPHCSDKRTNKVSNNQPCIDRCAYRRCAHCLTCLRYKQGRLAAHDMKSRLG